MQAKIHQEAFKARILRVLSDRSDAHPGDSVPSVPVDDADIVYHVYGYNSQNRNKQHRRWCNEYQNWNDLPRINAKRKLSEDMLQQH